MKRIFLLVATIGLVASPTFAGASTPRHRYHVRHQHHVVVVVPPVVVPITPAAAPVVVPAAARPGPAPAPVPTHRRVRTTFQPPDQPNTQLAPPCWGTATNVYVSYQLETWATVAQQLGTTIDHLRQLNRCLGLNWRIPAHTYISY